MTQCVTMRQLVAHAVGGGWGHDNPEDSTDCVAVIRGADFPAVSVGDGSGIPIRWEARRKLASRLLEPGDILLEISGGTSDRPTGRTVFASRQLLDSIGRPTIPASFCRLVRIDSAKADPYYVYWWLQGMYAQGRTWAYQNRSTGIANFQFEHFLDAEAVTLPPIQEQRGIAATLGALDDKIGSNRRAIDLLGDLARACYAQWRDSTPIVRVETFGTFADVFGGATPKTSEVEYWDGGLAWTTPTDVTRLSSPYLFSTSRTITDIGLRSCAAVMHPAGTIFMTSRATIGAFAVNQLPAATNQGFIAVRPREQADRWFLFEEMRSRVPEFLDNANGSTFMELSRGRFRELPLAVPARQDIDQLDRQLAPLHSKSAQLAEEINRLAGLRASLLPGLLSGHLRVAEACEGAA